MKIEQQIIEEIQNQFKGIGVDYTNNKDITAIAVVHGEGAEATIKALEKQIPKAVIAHEQIRDGKTTKIGLECPACGFWQDERHVRSYCPMCGQRLK